MLVFLKITFKYNYIYICNKKKYIDSKNLGGLGHPGLYVTPPLAHMKNIIYLKFTLTSSLPYLLSSTSHHLLCLI